MSYLKPSQGLIDPRMSRALPAGQTDKTHRMVTEEKTVEPRLENDISFSDMNERRPGIQAVGTAKAKAWRQKLPVWLGESR